MGIYEMWRKKKLKELKKHNKLETLLEIQIVDESRKFRAGFFCLFAAALAAMIGVLEKMSAILTGSPWTIFDAVFISSCVIFLLGLGIIAELDIFFHFQKEMQKELEGK